VPVQSEDGKKTFSLTLPVLQLSRQGAALNKLFDKGLGFLLFRFYQDWIDSNLYQYTKKLSKKDALAFRYTVKFLTGGVLEVAVDWLRSGQPIKENQLRDFLQDFFQPLASKYTGVLKILVEYT
jgi:hypothetical protein